MAAPTVCKCNHPKNLSLSEVSSPPSTCHSRSTPLIDKQPGPSVTTSWVDASFQPSSNSVDHGGIRTQSRADLILSRQRYHVKLIRSIFKMPC